ncbi:MAG: MarR family transcriptional regulator [Clostridiales bacterium]|nr:MarR family transcriptional regulator [Clostridiales bacterium]
MEEIHDRLFVIFSEVTRLQFLRIRGELEKIGMYPGQPGLLFSLNKKDGQFQKELAKQLNISPATMNVTIKRMEKNGLVRREQDKNDKRVSRVFICEEGKNICKKLRDIHLEVESECIVNLSKEEKIIARRILLQIRDNLLKSCKKNNIKVSKCWGRHDGSKQEDVDV